MEPAPIVEIPTSNSVEDLTNALHLANQRIIQQTDNLRATLTIHQQWLAERNEELEKMTLLSVQKSIESNHLHDLLSFAAAGHRIVYNGNSSWSVIFNN